MRNDLWHPQCQHRLMAKGVADVAFGSIVPDSIAMFARLAVEKAQLFQPFGEDVFARHCEESSRIVKGKAATLCYRKQAHTR